MSPGRDDATGDVTHLGAPRLDVGRYGGDPATLDREVELTVEAVALVDDSATLEHEVVDGLAFRFRHLLSEVCTRRDGPGGPSQAEAAPAVRQVRPRALR